MNELEFVAFLVYAFIGVAILAGALRVVFGLWVAYHTGRAMQQVFVAYNQAVLNQFHQVAWAIQQHQQQAAIEAEQRARREIARLPRGQRSVHEARLTDIMSGRVTLNTRTGEWEQ
jgi:hypothetical protein